MLDCIFQIVEPAQKIKILRARIRVDKPDIFIDQIAVVNKTDVAPNDCLLPAINENDPAMAALLKKEAEEWKGQPVKMDLALPVDV